MLDANVRARLEGALTALTELSVERYLGTPTTIGTNLLEDETAVMREDGGDVIPSELERRREPRIPTDAPAFVLVLNPVGYERRPARVLDISRNGLKIRSGDFLPPGALIFVRFGGMHVVGTVRYCVGEGPDFQMGVEISQMV
jgi:PilZ domain